MKTRQAVRAVLIDPAGAVLLMRVTEPGSLQQWWVTPGGGIDAGEDHVTALVRELAEELGHELPAGDVGPSLWHRSVLLNWNHLNVEQHETYYLVETKRFDPQRCVEGDDQTGWQDAVPRWWTTADLRASNERIAPQRLADLLDELRLTGPPPKPHDITER